MASKGLVPLPRRRGSALWPMAAAGAAVWCCRCGEGTAAVSTGLRIPPAIVFESSAHSSATSVVSPRSLLSGDRFCGT